MLSFLSAKDLSELLISKVPEDVLFSSCHSFLTVDNIFVKWWISYFGTKLFMYSVLRTLNFWLLGGKKTVNEMNNLGLLLILLDWSWINSKSCYEHVLCKELPQLQRSYRDNVLCPVFAWPLTNRKTAFKKASQHGPVIFLFLPPMEKMGHFHSAKENWIWANFITGRTQDTAVGYEVIWIAYQVQLTSEQVFINLLNGECLMAVPDTWMQWSLAVTYQQKAICSHGALYCI